MISIYSLECPIDNKIRYIGKTNNIKNRFDAHFYDLRRKGHKANWIKKIKQVGLKPIIEIIDEVEESSWQFWEQHYISLYKSWGFDLLNITDGGDGCGNHTIATRLKLSTLRKLNNPGKFKDGHKINLGRPPSTKGVKGVFNHSDETKLKISVSNIGRTHTKETKNKMSKNRLIKWTNELQDSLRMDFNNGCSKRNLAIKYKITFRTVIKIINYAL